VILNYFVNILLLKKSASRRVQLLTAEHQLGLWPEKWSSTFFADRDFCISAFAKKLAHG
jgi:hypothetical protein